MNSRGCQSISPRDELGGQVRGEKKVTPDSQIESNLQSLVQTRTGGDPDDEKIRFTDLTPTRIESELSTMGTPASDDLVRRWMDEQGLRLRKISKVIITTTMRTGGKPPTTASWVPIHAANPVLEIAAASVSPPPNKISTPKGRRCAHSQFIRNSPRLISTGMRNARTAAAMV